MDYVIACVKPYCVFNVYNTKELAEADLPRALLTTADWGEKEFHYTVMSSEEYRTRQRAEILSDPITEITEEQFMEALEVLPPLCWTAFSGGERFLMSEFLTGSYTAQYARFGDRYFTRTVDAHDRSTWITEAEVK